MERRRVLMNIAIVCIAIALVFLFLVNDRYYYISRNGRLLRIDNWTGTVDRYNSNIGHWQTYQFNY